MAKVAPVGDITISDTTIISGPQWIKQKSTVSMDGQFIVFQYGSNIIVNHFPTQSSQRFNFSEGEISCIEILNVSGMGKIFEEFNCLVIGFQSGNILFVSLPQGEVLLKQKLHDTPVIKIKSRSFPTIPLVGSEQLEEQLSVLFENHILILIEVSSLLSALRSEYMLQKHKNQSVEKPTVSLSFRKYFLKHSSTTELVDVITCGSSGYGEEKKGTMIVIVGKNPMISVYLSKKDEGSLVTLASQVASKLTSSLVSYAKSWWGTSKVAEPTEEPLPKSRDISVRTSVEDSMRKIFTVIQDGSGKLGAFADSLGRVCLLDLKFSPPLVVRMWKGYRDAQLGFIQIITPLNSTRLNAKAKKSEFRNQRYKQFLVIYAPRRGLLEIWETRNGGRQSILNVGENCQLIYSSATLGTDPKKGSSTKCYLLNRSNSSLSEIVIDMSLKGLPVDSAPALERFFKIAEKLDFDAVPDHDIQKSETDLLEYVGRVNSPQTLSIIAERVLVTILRHVDSADDVKYSVTFLHNFILQVISNLKTTVVDANADATFSAKQSSSHGLLQEVIQLQRIERIVHFILIMDEIHQPNSVNENSDQSEENINNPNKYLSYKDLIGEFILNLINDESNENNDKQTTDPNDINQVTESRNDQKVSLKLLSYFDLNTGALNYQLISSTKYLEKCLFQLLLTESKSYTINNENKAITELIKEIFSILKIQPSELQILFIKWYFNLTFKQLENIPKWEKLNLVGVENFDEDFINSIEYFIIFVLVKQQNKEDISDIDPLDCLYHRIADSNQLIHSFLLCKLIIEAYRKLISYLPNHRVIIQRWITLKKRIELILNLFYYSLPKEINSSFSLSCVSFETTYSLYHYYSFIALCKKDYFYNLKNFQFDKNRLESLSARIKQEFPLHFKDKQSKNQIKAHKIYQLCSLWSQNNFNEIVLLQKALENLYSMEIDSFITKGVILKIWKEFISPKALQILQFIEKTRKVPKESILMRSVQLNYTNTLIFFDLISKLLNLLKQQNKLTINSDNFRTQMSEDGVWPPLIDNLTQQLYRNSIDDICTLSAIDEHLLLVSILELIFKYSLQQVQPLQLFSTSNHQFFTSLMERKTTLPLPANIYSNRLIFIFNILPVDHNKAFELSTDLLIKKDVVLREYIVYLFSNNNDEKAFQYIGELENPLLLASQLISIIHKRVILFAQPFLFGALSNETKLWLGIVNKDKMPMNKVPTDDEEAIKVLVIDAKKLIHLIELVCSIDKQFQYYRCLVDIHDNLQLMVEENFRQWFRS